MVGLNEMKKQVWFTVIITFISASPCFYLVKYKQ